MTARKLTIACIASFSLLGAAPSPQPSATPTPSPALPIVGSVRLNSSSPQSLHAIPVIGNVLDHPAIARSATLTADQLLRAIPGFDRARSNSAFSNYGLSRLSLGGAGNDRAVIFVDGIPAQDAFGGQVDWRAIPPFTIDRVEVLRGPGSALYGSGGIGGVLLVDTLARPQTQAGSAVGTPETAAAQVRVAAGTAIAIAAAAYADRLSYSSLPPGNDAGAFRAVSLSDVGHVRVRRGGFAADVLVARDTQEEGRPNYAVDRALAQAGVSYARLLGRGDVRALLYARDAEILNVADRYPQAPGALLYTQHVDTAEHGLTLAYAIGSTQLRADVREVSGRNRQTGADGSVQSDTSGRQRQTGFALQETLRAPRFELQAGARADRVATFGARTDGAISPWLALRTSLSPALAFRAAAGSGFRAPYLNELIRSYRIGSITYAANARLVPERSGSVSAGLDLLTGGARIALDGTRTFVTDALTFATRSPALQQRANLGTTRTDAITLATTIRLGACARGDAWATAQDPRVTAGAPRTLGKQLAYVPRDALHVGIDATSGAAAIGAGLTRTGTTYADDLNTQRLPAVTLADFSVTVPVAPRTHLELAIENLGDERYLSSIDRFGPPRTARLILTFGNQPESARCSTRASTRSPSP